ncbi:MAG TPA: TlpA disulfide reductase family protein [Gaiellaceae bacterium]|nr:TlpA disulfide reductase family protein [Gaiellaceae bacterium]
MGRRLKLAAQVLAVALVAGLFGLLGWKVTHQGGGAELVKKASEGKKPVAPDFRLARLDGGGHLDLKSFRNKVVLVNFWASWCDPCKREMPRLEQAYRRYRDRGVVFLGVDAQDFDSSAKREVLKVGTSYPVVYDGAGKVLGRYGGLPLPRTFVIDRRGRLVDFQLGELEQADINRLVDGALRPA